jgi:hypothetical protein
MMFLIFFSLLAVSNASKMACLRVCDCREVLRIVECSFRAMKSTPNFETLRKRHVYTRLSLRGNETSLVDISTILANLPSLRLTDLRGNPLNCTSVYGGIHIPSLLSILSNCATPTGLHTTSARSSTNQLATGNLQPSSAPLFPPQSYVIHQFSTITAHTQPNTTGITTPTIQSTTTGILTRDPNTSHPTDHHRGPNTSHPTDHHRDPNTNHRDPKTIPKVGEFRLNI